MFRQYTVEVPSVPGKIRVKINKNGTKYVEYEVDRKYNKEKKYNIPVRKTIGLLVENDDTRMYPNENYEVFFHSVGGQYIYDDEHSSCMKVGTFIIIKEILEKLLIDKWLRKHLGNDIAGHVMDLITYMMISGNNSAQYYSSYAYSHPLSQNCSDSAIETFLNKEITRETVLDFIKWWNKDRNKNKPVYISFINSSYINDGYNINPAFSVAIGYDINNVIPLFYEDYYGSKIDISQLEFAITKAESLGYKNIGLIFDRGYFSINSFNFLDASEIPYISYLDDKSNVVTQFVRSHNNNLEQKDGNYIPYYDLYVISDDIEIKGLYDGDTSIRHYHLYYSKEKMIVEKDAISSSILSIKSSLNKLIESNCSMRDMKRYEAFFNLEYRYDESVAGDETKNSIKFDDKKLSFKKVLVKYTENTEAINNVYSQCGYFCLVTSEKMSAIDALNIYKSRDTSEKLFSSYNSFLDCKVYSGESLFIRFLALIVSNYIYHCVSMYYMANGNRENWMEVVSVIKELEKIELIRTWDGRYHLDHVITERQKEIFKIFGFNEDDIKVKLSSVSESLWLASKKERQIVAN